VTVVYEVSVRAGGGDIDAMRRWFKAGPAQRWAGLPRLVAFDAYFPCRGQPHDPYVNDGLGPAVLAMLSFPDEPALWDAIGSSAFERGLADIPAGAAVTADAMLRKFYSVEGETAERSLEAPFSYVVRYHRPALDERAFVEEYLASHPTLIASLPHVRTVLCYVPLAQSPRQALPGAGYMIGNEVAFDSLEHFNAAMASPVRHELRRHYRQLPAFSGPTTHYAMDRIRVR
jgi:hypothetical protein